ncbi:DUF5060 domain-containing protein [Paenibacillus sp. CF384]|uniref:DUF5060 domain-containing protein n=1 Tax=Paenibacillus sp. CF384 TaxID=1884382 RepID=UPI0008967B7B|nr:DUF5060 domain-containing protein [Paenibacillus sp. CF384]SDW24868.1 protein of unknown function [Paenibacillus sp. CF384]
MINRNKLALITVGSLFVLAAVGYMVLTAGNSPGSQTGPQQKEPAAAANAEKAPDATPTAKLPVIQKVVANSATVDLYAKFELTFELDADYKNPYDPREIDVSMDLTSPSGKNWSVNGFYDGTGFAWKVRFSPDEAGKWSYKLRATAAGTSSSEGPQGSFEAAPSDNRGWIQVSDGNKRYLEYRDGSSFYGVGVAYPWGITDANLDKIAEHGGNLITYWNGNYDSSGNGGGSNQLQSVTFGVQKIDPLKAKRIDDLIESFEQRELHMNFVIWPHDSLADTLDGWPKAWEKSGYSALGEAKDFFTDQEMWVYQEHLYRYIIARWGYSSAIGIWDLVCEINGTDGWVQGSTADTDAWTAKVHSYFKEHDPYGHPTMGSMAGNRQDYWDYGYKTLDLADRENYYNLSYKAYAQDIRKRWDSYEKPLIIGETGNVTDTLKYHQSIWISLASGLASSPFWWDFGQVSDDMFQHMKHLAAFTAGIDFREKRIPVSSAEGDEGGQAQAWAMQGELQSYGWLLAENGGAGGKSVTLPSWPAGTYTLSWYDPWTGVSLAAGSVEAADGKLVLVSPPYTAQSDLAFTITLN